MAHLRAGEGGLGREELSGQVRAALPWAGGSDLERALQGLVCDSLLERREAGGEESYRLPQ